MRSSPQLLGVWVMVSHRNPLEVYFYQGTKMKFLTSLYEHSILAGIEYQKEIQDTRYGYHMSECFININFGRQSGKSEALVRLIPELTRRHTLIFVMPNTTMGQELWQRHRRAVGAKDINWRYGHPVSHTDIEEKMSIWGNPHKYGYEVHFIHVREFLNPNSTFFRGRSLHNPVFIFDECMKGNEQLAEGLGQLAPCFAGQKVFPIVIGCQ